MGDAYINAKDKHGRHSDIGTMMNIYAEATEEKKKEAFKNLEGKIKIC